MDAGADIACTVRIPRCYSAASIKIGLAKAADEDGGQCRHEKPGEKDERRLHASRHARPALVVFAMCSWVSQEGRNLAATLHRK